MPLGPSVLGGVLWTLLAMAVAIMIVALMRAGRRRTYRRVWHQEWLDHRQSLQHGPGLLALDMRYARGEIGRDDYLVQRAAMLSAYAVPAPSTPPSPA